LGLVRPVPVLGWASYIGLWREMALVSKPDQKKIYAFFYLTILNVLEM